MAKGEVVIRILGDASDYKRAVGDADESTGRLGGAVKGLGKVAAVAGVALVGAGIAFGKSALDAAVEARKVTAQTEAVIKSTGGAAGVSVGQVEELAHKLQELSGVQDESIQAGSNMLLTFTNIKNTVGEGNDVFDQATQTMLDMSVATGTDATSSALQLGKALNDPIAGIGALTRVGVTFTEQQKDQIEAMVEAGDTAGAQKVILAELSKEFGGSAAAAGAAMGPFERLKLKFGDFQEQVGEKLLPVVEKAASFLTDKLVPGVQQLVEVFQAGGLGAVVDTLKEKFAELWPGVKEKLEEFASAAIEWIKVQGPILAEQLVAWAQAFIEWIVPLIPGMLRELGKLWLKLETWIYTEALPKIIVKLGEWSLAFVKWVGPILADLVIELGKLLVELGDWIVTDALPTIVEKLLEWGKAFAAWVPGALVDLLVELAKLYVKLETWIYTEALPKIVTKLGEWAAAFVGWVGQAILDLPAKLGEFALTLIDWIGTLPEKIATAASGMWDGLKEAFRSVLNWIIDQWNALEFTLPSFDPPGPGSFGGGTIGLPDIPNIGGAPSSPSGPVYQPGLGPKSAGSKGGGDTYITVNVSGVVGDDRAVIEKIRRGLVDIQRSTGSALGTPGVLG